MLPVKAEQPRFTLSCFFRSHNALPRTSQTVDVVGMDGYRPSPILRLFRGEAGKVKPALVEEIGGAVRTSRPNKRWDGIDDRPQVTFRLTQSFLSALAVVDVGLLDAPTGYTAFCVPEGQTLHVEPPIDAIGAPNAMLNLVWLTAVYR
jgi:hypothetical protein